MRFHKDPGFRAISIWDLGGKSSEVPDQKQSPVELKTDNMHLTKTSLDLDQPHPKNH